ncbi:hypothetical protein LMH87_000431 [Akanthomyces muscarius]|uniref:Secreted protein n=1 Tax=Akanthomyces muscarius TaxID=2231603 RepID=A0A9W8QEI2_AKAMU|nr:hypothetical protein LMH87_000431 [Akanthomyces muscarius]KAJ4155174.1 hypothetical protein LMH87_000431 [Akanthomyces muscarius]
MEPHWILHPLHFFSIIPSFASSVSTCAKYRSDEKIGTNDHDPQCMKETSLANQEPARRHKLPIIARTIMRATVTVISH